jgi:hypothetical protein
VSLAEEKYIIKRPTLKNRDQITKFSPLLPLKDAENISKDSSSWVCLVGKFYSIGPMKEKV